MKESHPDEAFFTELANRAEEAALARPAPARLKSRIFSALLEEQQSLGPLAGLEESKAGGRNLCVFEELVRIAPLGEARQSFNYCRICHARLLGENLEKAPIFWSGCPYAEFHNH